MKITTCTSLIKEQGTKATFQAVTNFTIKYLGCHISSRIRVVHTYNLSLYYTDFHSQWLPLHGKYVKKSKIKVNHILLSFYCFK